MNLLSQDVPVSMLPPPPHTPVGEATPTSGQDLEQLRRELHQLEIEYRVTTQQSKTYSIATNCYYYRREREKVYTFLNFIDWRKRWLGKS